MWHISGFQNGCRVHKQNQNQNQKINSNQRIQFEFNSVCLCEITTTVTRACLCFVSRTNRGDAAKGFRELVAIPTVSQPPESIPSASNFAAARYGDYYGGPCAAYFSDLAG
jgi:hypothetical protein